METHANLKPWQPGSLEIRTFAQSPRNVWLAYDDVGFSGGQK
jgi:hypothetical protein